MILPTAAPTARLVVGTRDPRVEARVRYAFAAYAALHGIRVVPGVDADVTVAHGEVDGPADLTLPAGYRPRPDSEPAPAPVWVDGLPSFHRAPGGAPDVLGEVFEWLAAPHEAACRELDGVGRVPPRHTLAGTHGLDRTVPWANRWLARLHAAVRTVLPRLPAVPPSPFGSPSTLVASHDLDHVSDARLVNGRRVAKNVGIALVHRRDLRTGLQIVGCATRHIVRREPALVGIDRVLRGEAERGVRSSFTAVAGSTHRRDPGYRLDDPVVASTLREIADDGHEVAVHGSYRSLEQPGRLAQEYAALEAAGYPPRGGRQHWLRYRGGELFRALDGVGALWDSSCGHADDVGYRHGAAFPFLPYDLERERAHRVVEIPLAVMDRALCSVTDDPAQWGPAAVRVLRAAGRDGWGGVAVLWHDDVFTGTTFPARLADAYWHVLDAGDRWVTAAEAAAAARARWSAAGALVTAPGRADVTEEGP